MKEAKKIFWTIIIFVIVSISVFMVIKITSDVCGLYEERTEALDFVGVTSTPVLNCLGACEYNDYEIIINGTSSVVRIDYTTNKWELKNESER